MSGSKSKPNSATSLSSTKRNSSHASRSKNQVGEEVYHVILPPLNSFFFRANTVILWMQEHDVVVRDRLAASFYSKDSEATLTVPIAKSSGDDSIDIMPSPKKKAGRSQSPTPSISVYLPGKISSNVFSDLALSVKQHFLQQLKRFAPKTEDGITNIRQEAKKINETLSSFQAHHLGLKDTVETYLKLKAQLQDRTPTIEVQNKRATY